MEVKKQLVCVFILEMFEKRRHLRKGLSHFALYKTVKIRDSDLCNCLDR